MPIGDFRSQMFFIRCFFFEKISKWGEIKKKKNYELAEQRAMMMLDVAGGNFSAKQIQNDIDDDEKNINFSKHDIWSVDLKMGMSQVEFPFI